MTRRRDRSIGAALCGLLAPLAACSDDDGGGGGAAAIDLGSLDPDGIEIAEPVPVTDRRVWSMSPAGIALTIAGDEICALDLGGDEQFCTTAPTTPPSPYESVAWSPDGTKVAYAPLAAVSRALPTSVVVVDLETETAEAVVADDDDETLEAFPSWADDGHLRFLRAENGFEAGSTRLVTLDLTDGEETAVDTDVELFRVQQAGESAFDGRAVFFVQSGQVGVIEGVDEAGDVDRLLRAPNPSGQLGGISDDGSAMAVSTTDFRTFVNGPAVYVRAGERSIESSWGAWATAIHPAGEVVAVLGSEQDSVADQTLRLWHPVDDIEVDIATADELGEAAPYWLRWLDDGRLVAGYPDGWMVVSLQPTAD